ncbi:MAG: class A sortase [Atopococcus tabaci]|uniref:Class A sortase n=1 Tax=Atopococcus tabaci TaxID=269774 RepID=A0AA43ZT76_9LACT|nr:class A sortase [Atopococcus tabaci]
MLQKLSRILGVGLIIIGVGLVLWNFIPDLIMSQQDKEIENVVQTISHDEILQNQQTEGDIQFDAVDDLSPNIALNEAEIPSSDLIIGQLVIPAIKMNLPIYKSLNNTSLMAGSAVLRNDMVMGQGNYALAGHYTHTSDYLFGPLRHLEMNQVARITDKNKIYEYQMIHQAVVPPTALHMIEDEQMDRFEGPILSLMQCYYTNYQNTGDRQFFIGELRDVYDYDEDLLHANGFYNQLSIVNN